MADAQTDYHAFLTRVVDDGIAAAKKDYAGNPDKLRGAVAGFEDCRGRSPGELLDLLIEAREATKQAFAKQADNYWFTRCRELEVEWVCNVASAALANQGLDVIVPPTARGALKAAEILGVKQA